MTNRSSGFTNLIRPTHKRVSRMVGFCLTLLDESSMWSLSAVINARLHSGERKWLAVSTLMALTDDEYQDVIDFMEGGS